MIKWLPRTRPILKYETEGTKTRKKRLKEVWKRSVGKKKKSFRSSTLKLWELVTFHKLTFICELLFEGASSVSLYLLLTMFICAHDNQTTNHRKNMLRISPFKIIFSILFLRDNVHKEKIRAILPTQDFVVMILLYQLAKMFPSSWSLITFFHFNLNTSHSQAHFLSN